MTLPFQLTFQGNQISLTLLGIIIFLFLFCIIYWLLSRDNGYLRIFDTLILLLFSALISARILAVILNNNIYSTDLTSIFNLLDKRFLYIGILFGLIISGLLITAVSRAEKSSYRFLDKIIVSYAIAVIPLLLLVMFAGKMLGIKISGSLGIQYSDSSLYMPVNIFRICYNLLFLIVWLFLRKNRKNDGMFTAIYLMLFGAIEFILRIFSFGYSATLFNIIDLQQLVCVLILFIGLVMLLDLNNIKLFKGKKGANIETEFSRKYIDHFFSRFEPIEQRERFSLSYSSIQDSINKNELSLKEKITIFGNTLKRKFKK